MHATAGAVGTIVFLSMPAPSAMQIERNMSAEDHAQDQELIEWERRQIPLATDVSFTYMPDEFGYGPAACRECQVSMPENRRAMGRKLCTLCQSAKERIEKHYKA